MSDTIGRIVALDGKMPDKRVSDPKIDSATTTGLRMQPIDRRPVRAWWCQRCGLMMGPAIDSNICVGIMRGTPSREPCGGTLVALVER